MTALFEHSSWVEARADALPSSGDRHADLMAVVAAASGEERLALIRAHPELAGKAAIDGTLTRASAAEQASAGLDRLTPAEFARFHDLNARYRARFGFPFIICVRLTDKAGSLAAMEGDTSALPFAWTAPCPLVTACTVAAPGPATNPMSVRARSSIGMTTSLTAMPASMATGTVVNVGKARTSSRMMAAHQTASTVSLCRTAESSPTAPSIAMSGKNGSLVETRRASDVSA